jgi:hypothetical protein
MNIGNLRAHLLIPRRPAEHAQRRKFSREQHLRIMGGAGGVKKAWPTLAQLRAFCRRRGVFINAGITESVAAELESKL